MESEIIEIHEAVKEIQTQQRQVLERLNQVVQNDNGMQCSCECAGLLHTLQSEIKKLISKVERLEEQDAIMKELISSATEELNRLQNRFQQSQQSVSPRSLQKEPPEVHVENVTEEFVNVASEQADEKLDESKKHVDYEATVNDDLSNDEDVVNSKTHCASDKSQEKSRSIEQMDNVSENTNDLDEPEGNVFNQDSVHVVQTDSEPCVESTGPVLNSTSKDEDIPIAKDSDMVNKGGTTDSDDLVEDNDSENVEGASASLGHQSDDLAQDKKKVKFKEEVTQKTVFVPSDNDDVENDIKKAEDIRQTVHLNDTELFGATGMEDGLRAMLRSLHKHRNSFMKKVGKSTDSSKPSVPGSRSVSMETQYHTPEVIKQTEKRSYDSTDEWSHQAAVEMQSAWDAGYLTLDGVHSILLIDISESMVQHWQQVQQFFNEYVSGLEKAVELNDMNEEHVALVTFGHETKVHKRLTNNFTELRECFGQLKLGGPSPMFGGIHMAIAAIAASDHQVVLVNNIPQLSKVILITDGLATDPALYQGPDDPELSNQQLGQKQLCEDLDSYPHTGYDLYIVPVGSSDMEFLNKFSAVNNAKVLDYKSGEQLSRRLYLMFHTDPISLSLGKPILTDGGELSEADLVDLMEIRALRQNSDEPTYHEETGSILPVPGTRVRRGPDWSYDDQDSGGPGTIIGHEKRGLLCYVNWDNNGTIDAYKFGEQGKFDIKVVDESRILDSRETIGVGCVVKPVQEMIVDPEHTISKVMKGIVLRLTLEEGDIPKALVRWQNGMRGTYTYEIGENPEILVCLEEIVYHVPRPERKTTKNKNKNKNTK